ncbi:MAG: DNA-binding protein [Micavibrio sp.]|nr:DNA-binding protein [Micavibrio sp.]|tara:strand:+ start:3460 stop:4125 length:666 start_codon:yes stop_codon:yes gene_type:complete
MFSHEDIWNGIDRLATAHDLSTSGLAKKAGLDPTTFNKSKRQTPEGKPRWPSTESLSKILSVTGATLSDLTELIESKGKKPSHTADKTPFSITSISFKDTEKNHGFDPAHTKHGSSVVSLEQVFEFEKFAKSVVLSVLLDTDEFEPLYRKNSHLVCRLTETLEDGDRVLVKSTTGKIFISEVSSYNKGIIELKCMTGKNPSRRVEMSDASWIAKIIWTSQS